jgi:hypothetical protein
MLEPGRSGQLSSTGTLSVRELLLLLNSALQAQAQGGDLSHVPVASLMQGPSSGIAQQQQQQQQ